MGYIKSRFDLLVDEVWEKLDELMDGRNAVNRKAKMLSELYDSLDSDEPLPMHSLKAVLVVIAHPSVRYGSSQDAVDQACMEAWKGIDALASNDDDAVGFDYWNKSTPVVVAGCWREVLEEYFYRHEDISGPHQQLAKDFAALGEKPDEKDVTGFMTFMHRLSCLKPAKLRGLRWLAQVLIFGCRCKEG